MEDLVVDDNVTNFLQAGVIEEEDGAWGFAIVLVRKKDGENRMTKKDIYSLPRIDETLEGLGVAPGDKDNTAFTTKLGLYRFVCMHLPADDQRSVTRINMDYLSS
ncbi:Thy-1 membrane glycoprotein isoform X1 [Phytophthora palmivora]|uniref:Thy-1 membrane glycoprotein isoform X1 n=1 Tax=Phytophthora palmivora TaxID=4796 RepID=A0A2P4YMA4_9STRA|nr:Thy-1 membrane glycoprotein isoform X1 [Phytophthora palmivora]